GTIAEHHAPPRPGVPRGSRARLDFDLPLADSGVVDGDMIIFANRAGPAHRVEPAGGAGLAHQAGVQSWGDTPNRIDPAHQAGVQSWGDTPNRIDPAHQAGVQSWG